MKAKRGFTKNDLVFTVACVVFMVLNLHIAGAVGRGRAKQAVCLANLRQWGSGFRMYAMDNDGSFMTGWIGHGWSTKPGWVWYWALEKYVGEGNEIRCCPEATQAIPPFGNGQWPNHAAWYIEPDMKDWGFRVGDYGSYGDNRYIYNPPLLQMGLPRPCNSIWHNPDWCGRNWKTVNVAGVSNIPVVGDATWVGGNPDEKDDPFGNGPGDMGTFNINRHNGAVNMLFMDWSARRVGLKELWTLKWHRQFNTCNQWTTCGGVEPNDWPEWMRD